LLFLVEVGFDFWPFEQAGAPACHHAGKVPHLTLHSAGRKAPRASGRTVVLPPHASPRVAGSARRAAGRAGVAVHCFDLVLALFIPTSSHSFKKPQIHPNPSLLALKESNH
ncbi:hypothetical protein HAX54_041609, partial [Datura stramonium]|nr:hypothetical protein [Datura stramonium]